MSLQKLKPLEQPCNKAAEREAEQASRLKQFEQQAGSNFWEEQGRGQEAKPSKADKSKPASRLLALFFFALF